MTGEVAGRRIAPASTHRRLIHWPGCNAEMKQGGTKFRLRQKQELFFLSMVNTFPMGTTIKRPTMREGGAGVEEMGMCVQLNQVTLSTPATMAFSLSTGSMSTLLSPASAWSVFFRLIGNLT
ncbi:hypothetical protein BaRGS_00006039 [Batillaria attramentaria]|uniref:Uncharacterized protein n=1 Tax=Batillaria attramentaria TaxID=370345 RepID=A0ABD0LT62_9CAEN